MAVGIAKRDAALYEALKGEQPIKVICNWCNPPHVLRDGVEPASHGICQNGIRIFESGGRRDDRSVSQR